MMLSLSVSALAQGTNVEKGTVSKFAPIHKEKIKSLTGEYKQDITVKKLTDFSGNEFELIETGNSGYYIFDISSGKYIEYSTSAPSPYLGKSGELVYLGPTYYYTSNNNTYSHTKITSEKDFNKKDLDGLQNTFSKNIEQSRKTKDLKVLSLSKSESLDKTSIVDSLASTASTTKYINNYGYIKYATYPANVNGTCGYVGACLILSYWNKTYPSKNIIPSGYLDSWGNLNTDGYTLQDELLTYGYGDATWGKNIRDALVDFCNKHGVAATSTYYIGSIEAATELYNNRPVILFGLLPDVADGGKTAHAVTAYGIQDGTLVSRFIVHYGWNGYEEVVLDGGLIASNTEFKLN